MLNILLGLVCTILCYMYIPSILIIKQTPLSKKALKVAEVCSILSGMFTMGILSIFALGKTTIGGLLWIIPQFLALETCSNKNWEANRHMRGKRLFFRIVSWTICLSTLSLMVYLVYIAAQLGASLFDLEGYTAVIVVYGLMSIVGIILLLIDAFSSRQKKDSFFWFSSPAYSSRVTPSSSAFAPPITRVAVIQYINRYRSGFNYGSVDFIFDNAIQAQNIIPDVNFSIGRQNGWSASTIAAAAIQLSIMEELRAPSPTFLELSITCSLKEILYQLYISCNDILCRSGVISAKQYTQNNRDAQKLFFSQDKYFFSSQNKKRTFRSICIGISIPIIIIGAIALSIVRPDTPKINNANNIPASTSEPVLTVDPSDGLSLSTIVYASQGERYFHHDQICFGIKRNQISLGDARYRGYTPCKYCWNE